MTFAQRHPVLLIRIGWAVLLFLVWFLCGCMHVQPKVETRVPPSLPKIQFTQEQKETAAAMAVIKPPPVRKYYLDWTCGCGQPLPHRGHEFDVERSASIPFVWYYYTTTNAPLVEISSGFYRVGCHLGNLP